MSGGIALKPAKTQLGSASVLTSTGLNVALSIGLFKLAGTAVFLKK